MIEDKGTANANEGESLLLAISVYWGLLHAFVGTLNGLSEGQRAHFADKKHQSLSPVLLTAQPQRATIMWDTKPHSLQYGFSWNLKNCPFSERILF